jgi:hypothetical protein
LKFEELDLKKKTIFLLDLIVNRNRREEEEEEKK